mgnify:CR=1 FL=1
MLAKETNKPVFGYRLHNDIEEHSVEEVLERPTGYPKVGGSNHGSGDFSLQPQRNPYLS